MSKTSIILTREYITRVRKPSFIVMTLLAPLLFAAIAVIPAFLAHVEKEPVRQIAVIDSSKLFIHQIPDTENYKFTYAANVSLEAFKKNLKQTEYFGVLYIPPTVATTPVTEFFSYQQAPMGLKSHISNSIRKVIETAKMKAHHIENLDDIIHSIRTDVDVRTFTISEEGDSKESHGGLNMAVAYIAAFLIYMFVFMFGSQVMRGVMEEKTNRIVEVIISSVKPFQLMMGKVIGIALVGLTQFVAWTVLTMFFVGIAQLLLSGGVTDDAVGQMAAGGASVGGGAAAEVSSKVFTMLSSLNFTVLLGTFVFYFLGGYLLYASLFAAIASAVDVESDTQQFMMPVTIPMILAIMVMMSAIQNPDGQVAFWFSMIPLTSPVVMMARIPFGVPVWQLALSAALLIVCFVAAIWASGKIYRTGILMYGKKITWKELWKWIKYK